MKQKLQIAAGIVGIGLAIAGYEFYSFKSDDVPKLEAERVAAEQKIRGKQDELKRLQDFAKNIEGIKGELKELNQQLDLALEHMPRTFNLSGLLRKLSMLAQNSGLELFTFKPGLQEEKVDGSFYSATTIDVDLKGTFTQVMVFFDQVSRLKRIVNADEIRIAIENGSGQSKGARSGPLMVSAVAKVRTYRFSE